MWPHVSSMVRFWARHRHALQLDIGTEALAVDRARRRRKAPAAWSPVAERRHVVLTQVSPMNTSRVGSRPDCQERQRCRRRAMSVRACSRANSVF